MNYQVVISGRGWHHINTPDMKRIGTVSKHPENTRLWCEVKTVDHKAVYGDEMFSSREDAAQSLFGITLHLQEGGTSVPTTGNHKTTPDVTRGHKTPAADKAASETKQGGIDTSAKAATTASSARGSNPGVVATIEKTLRTAGIKQKPVTKDDILKALVKAFPDRPAASMENTIRFTPGHLLRKGHKVKKVKGRPLRYFIAPPKQATA